MKLESVCAALWRFLKLVSPGGSHAKLPILIYHRVLAKWDPMRPWEITCGTFRWQMELVARSFHTLTLLEAVSRLKGGKLPARAICVTFDDGYRDNVEVALPILKRFGIPATFFISTGYLDGGRMWNDTLIEALRRTQLDTLDLSEKGLGAYLLGDADQRAGTAQELINRLKYREPEERQTLVEYIAGLAQAHLPRDMMMESGQVVQLRNSGMAIGAHTVTHPILANLTPTLAQQEIAMSRQNLEELIGEPVQAFAYPNGKPGQDYRSVHVEIVRKEGFGAAVTTIEGVSDFATSPWELRRFTPWDITPVRFSIRLLLNYRRRVVPGILSQN